MSSSNYCRDFLGFVFSGHLLVWQTLSSTLNPTSSSSTASIRSCLCSRSCHTSREATADVTFKSQLSQQLIFQRQNAFRGQHQKLPNVLRSKRKKSKPVFCFQENKNMNDFSRPCNEKSFLSSSGKLFGGRGVGGGLEVLHQPEQTPDFKHTKLSNQP